MANALLVVLALLLQDAPAAPRYAIAGRVQTSAGAAVSAVRIAVLPAPRENVRAAEGQNYYATQQPVAVTITDADGRYRLPNIAPGRYVIVAGLVGYGTFFPSTTDIDSARAVTVERGDVAGTDITLITFPGARVSGRVTPPPAAGVREWATLAGTTLGELVEVPIGADGRYEFGRVPPGEYLLSIFPTPPGQASMHFSVKDQDATSLEMIRPTVRRVRGRVAVDRGPLPAPLLGFVTPQSYVTVSVDADNTFDVGVHEGRHRVDMGGLPAGYSLRTVRVGGADVTGSGLTVGASDVSDVVLEVTAPRELPMLRGRIAGASEPGWRIQVTGRIIGAVEGQVGSDGSFTAGPLPPGLYAVRIVQRPDIAPVEVVVDSRGGTVTINAPPAGR